MISDRPRPLPDCRDPWHTDSRAPHATYHDRMGEWESESYGCLTCGFRTMTFETYTPVDKTCTRCGATFDGMPDVDENLCDECWAADLPARIAALDAPRTAARETLHTVAATIIGRVCRGRLWRALPSHVQTYVVMNEWHR